MKVELSLFYYYLATYMTVVSTFQSLVIGVSFKFFSKVNGRKMCHNYLVGDNYILLVIILQFNHFVEQVNERTKLIIFFIET